MGYQMTVMTLDNWFIKIENGKIDKYLNLEE